MTMVYFVVMEQDDVILRYIRATLYCQMYPYRRHSLHTTCAKVFRRIYKTGKLQAPNTDMKISPASEYEILRYVSKDSGVSSQTLTCAMTCFNEPSWKSYVMKICTIIITNVSVVSFPLRWKVIWQGWQNEFSQQSPSHSSMPAPVPNPAEYVVDNLNDSRLTI